MTQFLPPPRQQAGYSLKRRFNTWLRGLFGTQLLKSQDLRFVTINGQRFKRLILRDSFLAAEIERQLESFGANDFFPALVTRYENEVWVQFVDGERLVEVDERALASIADFYAAVYRRRPRPVAMADLPYMHRIDQNLRFLGQVGVLSDAARRDLEAVARRLAPEQVWIGFDYVDPVLKNFVIARDDGRLCAIDVESLADEQLIGTGVAKACVHWLEPFRDVFLERLAGAGVPDFQAYFRFVELAFVARWTKTKFLTQKRKFVQPERFDRFLGL